MESSISICQRFPTCTLLLLTLLLVLSKSHLYLEEEWAQGVRRGGNAIMTRQALVLFVILSLNTVFHSHLNQPDPFIWHRSNPPHTRTPLGYMFIGGPYLHGCLFFSHIIFGCAMACSWQQRELCMSLAPTAHSAGVENVSFLSGKPSFRRVFRSLTAIATTSAFHMHVFSAAAAEREELSGHECISLCLSYNFSFPSWLCFFFFSPLRCLFYLYCRLSFLVCLPLSHLLLIYFHPQPCGILRCPVSSLESAPAARPGRARVVPQQGHTAAWDWRAV